MPGACPGPWIHAPGAAGPGPLDDGVGLRVVARAPHQAHVLSVQDRYEGGDVVQLSGPAVQRPGSGFVMGAGKGVGRIGQSPQPDRAQPQPLMGRKSFDLHGVAKGHGVCEPPALSTGARKAGRLGGGADPRRWISPLTKP